MMVLALDTTTAAGSVAVVHAGRLLEVAAIDPSQPIATRVPGDLVAIVGRHGIALPRIDVFAVATGPGSFTGLRIGIAAMQGLALANAKPLVGVSSFEALAHLAYGSLSGADRESRVGVWIDAWRGEVYGAVYGRTGERSEDVALREIVEAAVAPPEQLLERAMSAGRVEVFIGDGAVKFRGMIPARVIEPTPLIAGAVAHRAHARAVRGEAPPPHAIRPLYVRRPDAELARERSSG